MWRLSIYFLSVGLSRVKHLMLMDGVWLGVLLWTSKQQWVYLHAMCNEAVCVTAWWIGGCSQQSNVTHENQPSKIWPVFPQLDKCRRMAQIPIDMNCLYLFCCCVLLIFFLLFVVGGGEIHITLLRNTVGGYIKLIFY